MVVKEEKPITMAEVVDMVGTSEKSEEIRNFFKDFDILPIKKVKEMKEELRALDLLKLKEEHIVKIIDFAPKDASELNKVVIDLSLNPEEVGKILDVTKKY